MPEYVYIIGLVLGSVYVGCYVIATINAYRLCRVTCKIANLQLEAMEKDAAPFGMTD